MQNSLIKAKHFCGEHKEALLMLGILVFAYGIASASNSGGSALTNDSAFKNGYDWLNSVMHGYLGILLAAVAFIIGLIIGIAKQSPMTVFGSFILALIISFGLDMATGIVNSSLVGSGAHLSMSVFELCFIGGKHNSL